MVYEVILASREDFSFFVPRLFEAMGKAHFIATCWPDNQTESGQRLATDRWMEELDVNPDVKWIKAIDTTAIEANGRPKIVGIAQYTIFQPHKEYPEVPYFLRDHAWPDVFEKEYAMHLWEGYVRPRRDVLKTATAPVINLQILCVWPEYRRKGIGSQLTQWGTHIADTLGVACIVEAGGMGGPLYAKMGYKEKEVAYIEDDPRFNERSQQRSLHHFMMRSRREPFKDVL